MLGLESRSRGGLAARCRCTTAWARRLRDTSSEVRTGQTGLVFPHPHTGGPLDSSKVLKRLKAALRVAGVRQITFHELRHTFGTQMAAAGVPMRTLQEWMGHRDIKTTLIYADYAPSDHEREFVERAFAGTNSGTKPSETQRNSQQGTVPERA